MPETGDPLHEPEEGDVMAGDRRIARTDSALPDWYVSDGAYRPIPIAWFAGALVLQVVLLPLVFVVTFSFSGAVTIAVSMLVSVLIGQMTWRRGMAKASAIWRWSTVAMLLAFFGIIALASLPRI